MEILAQFEAEGRTVSDKPGPNYAPKIFADHPDANGVAKLALKKAMDRLFKAGRIKIEEWGPPSRLQRKIVAVAPNEFAEPPISEEDQEVDCPVCRGEGIGRVHVEDTRNLSGKAKLLFAGVKKTRHGVEVQLHDQLVALEKVARHLGMLSDRIKVSGDSESPLTLLIKSIQGSALKPVKLGVVAGSRQR